MGNFLCRGRRSFILGVGVKLVGLVVEEERVFVGFLVFWVVGVVCGRV